MTTAAAAVATASKYKGKKERKESRKLSESSLKTGYYKVLVKGQERWSVMRWKPEQGLWVGGHNTTCSNENIIQVGEKVA